MDTVNNFKEPLLSVNNQHYTMSKFHNILQRPLKCANQFPSTGGPRTGL